MAIFVQMNLRLREIEVDGSAFSPLFPQNSGKHCHLFKHRHKLRTRFTQLPVMILQDLFHFRVRHSPVNANHRFHDFMGKNGSFFVNLHEHTHCQPVFSRI